MLSQNCAAVVAIHKGILGLNVKIIVVNIGGPGGRVAARFSTAKFFF